MSISVLVSTMNNDETLIKKMNINSDFIIINQLGNNNKVDHLIKLGENKFWVDSHTRGLSMSRNKALYLSDANISVIADDDLIYTDEFVSVIENEYYKNPEYDILIFEVHGINKKFKDYPKKEKELGFLSSMKVSSVQITFRTNEVKENNITFPEEFGSGSIYSMGEENIFLSRCIEAGLRVKFIPQKIADLYIGQSTWFKGYNKKYLIDRGASFTAMNKKFSFFLIIQFAIRKRSLFKDENIGVFKMVEYMLKGRRDYLKGKDN